MVWFLSKSEGKTRRVKGVNLSLSPKTREEQRRTHRERESSLTQPFIQSRPSGVDKAHHIGKGGLLYSVCQFSC